MSVEEFKLLSSVRLGFPEESEGGNRISFPQEGRSLFCPRRGKGARWRITHYKAVQHQQSDSHCPESDLFRGPNVKKTDHITSRFGGGGAQKGPAEA